MVSYLIKEECEWRLGSVVNANKKSQSRNSIKVKETAIALGVRRAPEKIVRNMLKQAITSDTIRNTTIRQATTLFTNENGLKNQRTELKSTRGKENIIIAQR